MILGFENVFRHDSGVCHIVYSVWDVIEWFYIFPLLFIFVVPFDTYLKMRKTSIAILPEFCRIFILSRIDFYQ